MRRLSIDSVLQLVRELPRLPETHVRVMNMAMNAGTSVAEITRVINTDAALTARVLQVANTPFYGMTGRIETVARATVILGMRTVHSLALGAGIVETLNAPDPREHCGIDIWKHSLQTAVAAQELAESGGVSDSEIAFTAGLLHDMGKLILATGFPDIYRQVLEEHAATCVPLVTLEQRLFGINHATAGGMLCRSWNLPVSLRAIVEN
ncbi:MAG: HDOD domain-containing protein, partial [Planctomycetaceae bacterium]|nr:HDOD domain-containing protein [Planctomycetaceae bacterium]